MLLRLLFGLLVIAGVGYFFYQKSKDPDSIVNKTTSGFNEDLTSAYSKVPMDELYSNNSAAKKLLAELNERYKRNFDSLARDVKAAGAKLIICWITTEPYRPMNTEGKKVLQKLCEDNGLDFVDFVPDIMGKRDITFMPKDGHFNKKGAKVVAEEMANYIRKYNNARSTRTFSTKPKLFGDLQPDQKDNVLDGGKNLPYKLTTNSQGLRMNYDLADKKTKQRILLLGDSGFYFPFLDNPETGSGQLQSMFPDKEILNSAQWGYAIDDYWSQWNERSKYTEADIIFIETSGEDITNQFISHRLKFSRHKERLHPSELEKKFYSTLK